VYWDKPIPDLGARNRQTNRYRPESRVEVLFYRRTETPLYGRDIPGRRVSETPRPGGAGWHARDDGQPPVLGPASDDAAWRGRQRGRPSAGSSPPYSTRHSPATTSRRGSMPSPTPTSTTTSRPSSARYAASTSGRRPSTGSSTRRSIRSSPRPTTPGRRPRRMTTSTRSPLPRGAPGAQTRAGKPDRP